MGQYDRKSIWELSEEVQEELMMGSALTVGCGQVKHLHLGGKKGGGGLWKECRHLLSVLYKKETEN